MCNEIIRNLFFTLSRNDIFFEKIVGMKRKRHAKIKN